MLYEMPKNWHRRMCGDLRIGVLNLYWSIFGITGHSVKNENFEFRVFYWLLDSEVRLPISCSVLKWQQQNWLGVLKKSYLINFWSFWLLSQKWKKHINSNFRIRIPEIWYWLFSASLKDNEKTTFAWSWRNRDGKMESCTSLDCVSRNR